jgi:hypothetical protein
MAEQGTIPGGNTLVPDDTAQNIDPRLINMFVKGEGNVGVQNFFRHSVEPLKLPSKTDNEFVFDLPQTGASFIDLQNIELYVRGTLTRLDGTDLVKDEKVLVSNDFLSTLFDSVSVYIGHNQMEIATANFPYKAFIKQLNRFKHLTSQMRPEGYDVEIYDKHAYSSDFASGMSRYGWTSLSKSVEFEGPVLLDFFTTPGYLLPACPVKIKFRKAKDLFYVVTDDSQKDTNYNFSVDKMVVYVPSISINPQLTPMLEASLDQFPAAYRFEGLQMKQYSVPASTLTRKYPRLYEHKIPKRIMVGFFPQAAFSGDRTRTPLMAADLDVTHIALRLNGVVLREFHLDYKENQYLDVYKRFLEFVGAEDQLYQVNYTAFKSGYRYYCFELQKLPKDERIDDDTITQGFLDLEFTLSTKPTEECVMTVFSFATETVEIHKSRTARYIPTIV